MKLLLTSLTIFVSTIFCYSQVISTNINFWGLDVELASDKKYLMVTEVITGSLADIAGLRRNDRIYTISDVDVENIHDPVSRLNQYSDTYQKLGINRITKHLEIYIPHFQNVSSFNDYLTEGVLYNKIIFSDKIPTWTSGDIRGLSLLSDNSRDLFKYKTYDFEYCSQEEPLLEKKIFEELDRQFNEIGLERNNETPDLLILMSYYSGSKENYTPPQQIISTRIEKAYNWYWGYIPVPITESKTINGKTSTTNILTMHIKVLDANEIKSSKMPPVVWQGSMTKVSKGQFNILNQCKSYFETMLYQFPEVWKESPFTVITPFYYYTGILYSKNDLNVIFDVIPGSPAEKAGLKKGDKILKINEYKIPSEYEDIIADDYFVGGVIESMPQFDKKKGAGFYYLGCKNSENMQSINFNISRNGNKMNVIITPEVKRLIFIY